MKYEVIVVGGGHAGIEASHIAAFKGHKTLLIIKKILEICHVIHPLAELRKG